MSLRLVPLAVLLTAVLVGFTGCTATVDTDKAEELVSDVAQNSQGQDPTDVSCPSDTEFEDGKTFTCTVEYSDGTAQKATVRMRGDDEIVVSPADFEDQ